MTGTDQTPSPASLVVKAAPGSEEVVRADLADLGAVDTLGRDDLLLLQMRDVAADDAKTTWQRVTEAMGQALWAAPVLLDTTGQAHYPTGEITLRFTTPPDDTGLEKLAEAHGLRPRHRNEFVPEQVSFLPAEPRATYLPDLVRALAREEGVAAAWANTLSRYQRR